MQRFVCIHGHFYQPPRENPWLEDIEVQDTAYPYHNWNERITHECYEPNTASRILDDEGRIRKIVNNYAKISFDFGPTLLSWMETRTPEVYRAVIQADRESKQHFSGHGSALALVYSHMIMPLANRRDKDTQVAWGIRDFEYRFGRQPEGMFLAETAVDLQTLGIMAEQGIRFTLLAPHQAARVRKLGTHTWREVKSRGIDPTMPYQIRLPGADRTINIFFYDGPISRAIAFEDLLVSGEHFAHRLLGGFNEERSRPQLVHVATDGETYGHHHQHGEMALAYALHHIEANKLTRITNYGEYLERHPPTHEVEIIENSSWSCAHGIERWRNDCGCNSGMRPGWNQGWRAPLRDALDWLRDALAPQYEEHARCFLKNPWTARNDYIAVVLDRSPKCLRRFLADHSAHELNAVEQVKVWKLLEMQRYAMLMYTSCGWFFDDISGIETVQVIRYAGRVLQLAQELFDNQQLEVQFLGRLAQAKSNAAEHRDGAHIYERFVKPAMVDLPKVGAHYAISSLFETYGAQSRIYCYTVDRQDYRELVTGKAKLTVGRAKFISEITRESETLSYGALYFGYHNLNGGVRVCRGKEAYQEMVQAVTESFERADIPGTIRLLDQYFVGATYSLKQLFRDQQRKILELILTSTLAEVEADYRRIYERHASLMRFLKNLDVPRPKILHAVADFVLNVYLRRSFSEKVLDLERITVLLHEAEMLGVRLDGAGLGYVLKQTVERMAERLSARPTDLALLENLEAVIGLARSLPFEVDLWKVQNVYYKLLHTVYPILQREAERGDEDTQVWVGHFAALGEKLRMRRGT
jgi:alpha-amylase/alpha-mannosidase (GH57 family)